MHDVELLRSYFYIDSITNSPLLDRVGTIPRYDLRLVAWLMLREVK